MVVGWYHSHPGFGCWLSGVDINTQQVHILPFTFFLALTISLIELWFSINLLNALLLIILFFWHIIYLFYIHCCFCPMSIREHPNSSSSLLCLDLVVIEFRCICCRLLVCYAQKAKRLSTLDISNFGNIWICKMAFGLYGFSSFMCLLGMIVVF